ncbi:carbohydrate ABC transporter permease [Deinococcus yavapaiensis]|uniref:Carbohydrate ABC transporter membrane protein 2 (CUT1 family) n=1 Tax=Deinococcus yavapaiensis KR-236 TaxID=694435 RepID=A0A318SAT1_9DEIO|nr:carbohydrate ABC transporter permease [Deinococcus yavapaiensis]PYE56530.1 carbohydrate ABC transporter membrane protein 2 (CUT1 family) [Deinococcus yavapaiensis KR-236]
MAVSSPTSRAVTATPSKPPRRLPRDIPRFILLCILSVIFLAPVYWMISTSLKPEADVLASPVQWIPRNPTLDNYRAVLTSPDGNILRWTWNSFYIALVFTIAHVFLCAITAYPLARMRFRGRNGWFWFILSSLMIPGIVTFIPTYLMMFSFHWIDTPHALIWPGVAGVFGIFLLRQFFMGIPKELEEAAVLDGAGSWTILWRIILPLALPALVTLAVFSFMGSWNNYIWPLFVVSKVDQLTLPVGVTTFSQRYVTDYGKLMATATIAAVPALIAYLLAQRFLVEGLATTGMKE